MRLFSKDALSMRLLAEPMPKSSTEPGSEENSSDKEDISNKLCYFAIL